MKTKRLQTLMAVVLACGLIFTSTSLFAQARVPVGSPVSASSHAPSVPTGPLPEALTQPPRLGGAGVTHSYDGIDFLGSNCGCLPPDTNAAVGNNYVVETVNFQIRIFDKTTDAVLLDEPLQTFFGAPSGGDPYVVYDELANRWYVNAFDSGDSGLFLAVSHDGNPLDGFTTFHLTNVGGFPDYAKAGYNHDAVFISYNNFGTGGGALNIASIDKAQLLGGTLVYFVSVPNFQFRAQPPARMHGDNTGGTEWFVSTDGTDAGGNTIRVTKMTNYLSNSPTFTYTSLPVHPYTSATVADQPGGPGSVTTFPNTTTYVVQYHNKRLVTAMASTPGLVGGYPKGLWYEVWVGGGVPVLMQEGLIDPGQGVAVQMPSVEVDSVGNFGLTWIESSLTEFVSMWVGTVPAIHFYGQVSGTDVAPGLSFMADSFRIGDYSSTVLDSDGKTFWSANEFVNANGSTDIWSTHIAAFKK
jgi:hypothetical protein